MPTSLIEHDVLARHGIEAGPGGYGLLTLEATAAAHGWSHRTEERTPGSPRGRRYQALVYFRGAPGADPRFAPLLTARGRGETEEAALAQALARMLLRER